MATVLNVVDMTCEHCRTTVEGALSSVEGVKTARVDLEAKTATVEHSDDVDEALLKQAVVDAGYSVVGATR
jgi:copper chaperone CopZ